jgi:hypothetical protein
MNDAVYSPEPEHLIVVDGAAPGGVQLLSDFGAQRRSIRTTIAALLDNRQM